MASVNKVMLLGNVGKDPEVRYTTTGMAIANLSLATSSKRKDKNTGEIIEETQWHRVQFFDRLAEIVGEYITKGSSIFIEGRLKYGSYEKDGVKHYTTDIVAEQMQMLGSKDKPQGGQNETRQQAQQRTSQQEPEPRHAPPRGAQQPPRGTSGSGFDDMDDDIPF